MEEYMKKIMFICFVAVLALGCPSPTEPVVPPVEFDGVIFSEGLSHALKGPYSWGDGGEVIVTGDTSDSYEGSKALELDGSAISGWGSTVFDLNGMVADLSEYNALTFYAKTDSGTVTWDQFGLGASNTDTLQISLSGIELTTTWTKFVLPLPDPAAYTNIVNVFYATDNVGAKIILDNLQFENIVGLNVSSISGPGTIDVANGSTKAITGLEPTFNDGTSDITGLNAEDFVQFFSFVSADPAIATVDANGVVTGVALGSTTITATIDGVDEVINVTVSAPTSTFVVYDDALASGFGAYLNSSAYWGPAATDSTDSVAEGSYSIFGDIPDTATWGGMYIELGGQDVSSYTELVFQIDKSALDAGSVDYLQLVLEDTTNPQVIQNLYGLTPTATVGNWETYTIDITTLAPFDLTLFQAIGFYHPRVGGEGGTFTPLNFYVDDVKFQ
jgi:hypothetical protein